MNPSSFFIPESEYIELESRSEELQGAHEVGCGPPDLDLLPIFFIISKKMCREVSGHSENFCFYT